MPLTQSKVFAGLLLGLAALSVNASLPGRNHIPSASPEFEVGAATHETRTESQTALEFSNAGEIPAQAETSLPQGPTPTRSSFMASWGGISGAIGYRLDVSVSSSFSSYVDGYHDLDVGNVTGRVVTGLNPGTTYYYRVRAYDATSPASYSDVMTVTTVDTPGLIIHATFDSSITGNPNAAAIEAMINRAISIYESLFSDPITVQIRFRYATTLPNGDPMPAGSIARSNFVYYVIPWNTAVNALRVDAKTSNDNLAIASLPGSALSANIKAASANGRAVGGNTPPAMFANGTVGNGGPYDGIVTLNSAAPYQFSRPPSASNFDAQRLTEHEIGEVMGLGSRLNLNPPGTDLRPQDVFSWSSSAVRNISSSGTRFFSINGGVTHIVNFNQDPNGDFGDWLSTACPQAHPYVQNAFACTGQYSDVTPTSPEGINLDVIGYDLVNASAPPPTDFNNDGHPDFVLFNSSTGQTAIWYLNNNVRIRSAFGPTLWPGWNVAGVADFNRDGHPDFVLSNSSTGQTAIWYLNNNVRIGSAFGPTPWPGWSVAGVADFNRDGHPDFVLFNSSTGRTAIWYLSNNVRIASAFGPTAWAGWSLVAP